VGFERETSLWMPAYSASRFVLTHGEKIFLTKLKALQGNLGQCRRFWDKEGKGG